jgi:putative transposase
MPRPHRIRIPGLTFHVVQRGHNGQRTFFSNDDFRRYIELVALSSRRYATEVHAYVLMSNHVHLLMTSSKASGISRTMQMVGSNYVREINEQYDRTGTLWEGRFRSSPIDSEFYCLACYRYIELNPVRAGLVSAPGDYRWSSFLENTGQQAPRLTEPHPSFLALGLTDAERVARYREIVRLRLPTTTLETIRLGTRKGSPVGSAKFRQRLAAMNGRGQSPSEKKGSDPS